MRSAAELNRASPPAPADLRRRALRQIRDGALMFVVAGGLFGWYVWWAESAGDPAPGTWSHWVLKWFWWLIGPGLFVLLGAALAGPCVVYDGFRKWLRAWRGGQSEDEDAKAPERDVCFNAAPAAANQPAPVRLECRKCGSAKVEKLPPNGISPCPGYRCGECGAKMRAPGMLFVYLVALALGAAFGGFFLCFMLLAESDEPKPLAGFWFVGVGLICAGYSFVQLVRPVPRGARSESE